MGRWLASSSRKQKSAGLIQISVVFCEDPILHVTMAEGPGQWREGVTGIDPRDGNKSPLSCGHLVLSLQTLKSPSLLSVRWTSGRARRLSPTLCGSTRAATSPSRSRS